MYTTLLQDSQLTRAGLAERSLARPSVSTVDTSVTSLVSKTTTSPTGYYDYPALDDTSNFAANLLQNTTTACFKIQRGVLNQHVCDLLHSEADLGERLLFLNVKFFETGKVSEKAIDDELF